MNGINFINYLGLHRIKLKCTDEQICYCSSTKTDPSFRSLLYEYKSDLMYALQPFGNQDVIICPQSYNQQSLWFTNSLFPQSNAYNVVLPMSIESHLDINILFSAIKQIVSENEQLRTIFDLLKIGSESIPCQFILQNYDDPVKIIDGSGFSDAQIDAAINSFCTKAFSLKTECPFKVLLLSFSQERYYLVFLFHHIVCDARSLGIFFNTFLKYYHLQLPDINKQISNYTDFVFYQNSMIAGTSGDSLAGFWRDKYSSHQNDSSIPADFNRATVKKPNGSTIAFNIDGKITDQINVISRSLSITPFAYYLSCLQLLIISICNRYSLTTGILSHGRTQPEHNDIIGYFINPLPVFCSRSGETAIETHIKTSNKELLEAISNQHMPFPLLVEKIAVKRDSSRHVLFDILLNMFSPKQLGDAINLIYPSADANAFTCGDLRIRPYPINQQEGQFDLSFELFERDNCMQGQLKYSTDLYTKETAENLVANFCTIIEGVLSNSHTSISDFIKSLTLNNSITQKAKWNLVIASTFTSDILDSSFKFWTDTTKHPVEWHFAPYNQIFQQLIDPQSMFSLNKGINIILLRFEDLCIHDDNSILNTNILDARIKEFIDILQNALKFHPTQYLVAICPSSPAILKNTTCASHFANSETFMQDALLRLPGVYFAASEYFTNLFTDTDNYEPSSGIIGHVPYTDRFYTAIGTGIIRLVHAMYKSPCKAIIVDCDNTLWEGIAGEDTWKNIKLTNHHKALQQFLINCKKKGILLCLCSKNNRDDVIDVFEKHPDMILSFSDFLFDRINWRSKSENIHDLLHEANLSTSGIVFIDDSPSECAEVQANCQGITVINLSPDSSKWQNYLNNFWALDNLKITDADIDRQNNYVSEKNRRSFKEQVTSFTDFINGLNLNVSINPTTEDEIARISQLTFRTNQFSTGAAGKSDLQIASLITNKMVYSVRVNDRFGDYGLVGAFIYSTHNSIFTIDHLLLSCRALSRGVEYKIIAFIGNLAESLNCSTVNFTINKTGKNIPLIIFFKTIYKGPLTEDSSFLHYSIPSTFLSAVTFNPETQTQMNQVSEQSPLSPALKQNVFPDELLNTIADICSDFDALYKKVNHVFKSTTGQYTTISKTDQVDNLHNLNTTEMILYEIWTENVRTNNFSINDNFFDLGGKSIMLPFMVDQIITRTGKIVSIVDLLQYPTIASLADHIDKHDLKDTIVEKDKLIAERQKKAFARFKK